MAASATSACHATSADGGKSGISSRSLFFSSRRRHTRCLSDWSSDVCSSDLWSELCCACGLCTLYACPEDLYPKEACDRGKHDRRAAGLKFVQQKPVEVDRKST